MNDDELGEVLRRVVPDAPEPDPAGLVAAGRRRRTRLRAVGASGTAVVAVAAIAWTTAGLGSSPAAEVGPGTPTSTAAEPDTGPVEMRDGEVVVSCGGGPTWVPSVMADGVPGVLTDAEARDAFQAILDDPQLGGEAALSVFPDGADAVDWRVLAVEGDALVVGIGLWGIRGPVPGAFVLHLQRDADGWTSGGFSSCGLQPVLTVSDVGWARVTGARTTTVSDLTLGLTELQCTGSRDPEPFLRDPVVVETDETVTIYATTTPFEGDATCPGNPTGSRDVRLRAPLGDRTVFDGSVYPPRPLQVRTAAPAGAEEPGLG